MNNTTVYLKTNNILKSTIIKKLAEKVKQIKTIDNNISLDIFKEQALIIWENPPSKESGLGKFLRLMYTLPHIEIIAGSSDKIKIEIQQRLIKQIKPITASIDTRKHNKQNNDLIDFNLTDKHIILIIPPNTNYSSLESTLSKYGAIPRTCQIPSMQNREEVSTFKERVKNADFIFVWADIDSPKEYHRIAVVLEKMMDTKPILISKNNWKNVLNTQFKLEIPITKNTVTKQNAINTNINHTNTTTQLGIDKLFETYLELLHQFKAYSSYLEKLSAGFAADSPLHTLHIQIKRWHKTILNYRNSLNNFKPYPTKPCPKNSANLSAQWDQINLLIEEQSEIVKNIYKTRLEICQTISYSKLGQSCLNIWGIEVNSAINYISKILFRNELQKFLTDFIKNLKNRIETDTSLKLNKQDKLTNEADIALKRYLLKYQHSWASFIDLEINDLNLNIIDEFWHLYTDIAILWGDLANKKNKRAMALRQFLRCGKVPEQLINMPKNAKTYIPEIMKIRSINFKFNHQEMHCVYFDELIELLIKHKVAPSFDEFMELNQRGSTEWKQDRILRRVATEYRLERIYTQQIEVLNQRIQDTSRDHKYYLQQLKETKKSNREKYDQIDELAHSARIKKSRAKTMLKKIIEMQENLSGDFEKNHFTDEFPQKHWISKEVKNLRAKIRLMNKLKESHIPEVLAEELQVNKPQISTVKQVSNNLNNILHNDPSLFDLTLIPHKARKNSLITSCPAICIIAPGGGQTGFSMEPATDSSEGRLILPMFINNNMGLRYQLVDCLSDFRWDSCIASAGSNWVTSDTFVAAFARCRWDFRHKSKEAREKAMIYKDENDKMNWRRHYRLFEKSAQEAGKLLFYKNKLVYKQCMPYFVLPNNLKILKD